MIVHKHPRFHFRATKDDDEKFAAPVRATRSKTVWVGKDKIQVTTDEQERKYMIEYLKSKQGADYVDPPEYADQPPTPQVATRADGTPYKHLELPPTKNSTKKRSVSNKRPTSNKRRHSST